MASERFRNFGSIVYPDSCDIDVFVDSFDNLHIPGFLSPCHDRDVDKDGQIVKAHYHLLVMFEGKKSFEQVKALLSPLGCHGLEVVQSIRGSARYLCHLDNPEKAHYSPALVRSFSGADYTDVIMSEADRASALMKLQDIIDDNGLTTFNALNRWLRSHRENDLFRIANFSCAFPVSTYIKSKYERIDKQ